jgi:hypothetical protein
MSQWFFVSSQLSFPYQRSPSKGKWRPHRIRDMVLNATFNNIWVISWRSILLVEEFGVPIENHRPAASHWQALSHNVASSMPRHERDSNIQLYWWEALTYISGCKSNYHTITTTTASILLYSVVSIHAVYEQILIALWVSNISWLCNKMKNNIT